MTLLAAAADSTPQVPWWYAFVAAVGSGLIVGLLAFVGNHLERRHDKQERGADRQEQREAQEADHRHERQLRLDEQQHDLAVRREEDQRGLRDARLQRLQDGLASMVSAALDLQRLVDILPEHDPVSDEERRVLFDGANAEYLRARAALLLDPDGWKVVNDLEALQRDIRSYGIMVNVQRRRIEAGESDVDEHQERLDWHYSELRAKVDKLVKDCRSLVEHVAASLGAAARVEGGTAQL